MSDPLIRKLHRYRESLKTAAPLKRDHLQRSIDKRIRKMLERDLIVDANNADLIVQIAATVRDDPRSIDDLAQTWGTTPECIAALRGLPRANDRGES